jgi:uncharacterized OsmC-like protein
MKNPQIRQAIGNAVSYLTQHPDEARYVDSEAVAVLENGLQVTVTGPDGASVVTDMPSSVGGGGVGPSPGWMMRAAQASCLATLTAMRAAQVGVDLQRIEVIVDSESDDRGILGIDELVPAGPLTSRARVRVDAKGLVPEDLEALVLWAESHCPVQDALRRPVTCTVDIA